MSRRLLNSSFGNEYRSSSQSNQPVANMRSGNGHPTNSHSGILTNLSSLEVDFNLIRTVLADPNLKSPRDTQPQRNMPSIQTVLDVLPSLQIDFDLLRSVLADPTIKKADNVQSHPTNYSIQQLIKTQQRSSTSGFEWQSATNNERRKPYADIEGVTDSESPGKPTQINLPDMPPSLQIDFDLLRSVLADPSIKKADNSQSYPTKSSIQQPAQPHLSTSGYEWQPVTNDERQLLYADIQGVTDMSSGMSMEIIPPHLQINFDLSHSVLADPSFKHRRDSILSAPIAVAPPIKKPISVPKLPPRKSQPKPFLDASNSTLSSDNAFNSFHTIGSSQHATQQYTVKQRNQPSESSNFANTDESLESSISKDDCTNTSSESTIETSSLKRKRDDDDLEPYRLYCSICNIMVNGDKKLHKNGNRHRANTLLREKNPKSTPTTDYPAVFKWITAESAETILATAKSSGSTPGSSDTPQLGFHCPVCVQYVLYPDGLLHSKKKYFHQLNHRAMHKYGLSSLQQYVTCRVCRVKLKGEIILPHVLRMPHIKRARAKGIKDNESDIFIVGAFRANRPPKDSTALSTVPKDALQPAIKDSKRTTVSTPLSRDKFKPYKTFSSSSPVSKDDSELELRELSEHEQHGIGATPTTAKSNGSIPDSSKALLSKPTPGSSANRQRTFHCSVCNADVSFSNDNLSAIKRSLEQHQHRTMHSYGLSSLEQYITCTLCKFHMTGRFILEHKNGQKHQQKVDAMGMKGNESDIFIPVVLRRTLPLKASITSSAAPKVSLKPAIKDSNATTTCTQLSKDKIEPPKAFSASSAVSKDSSKLELRELSEHEQYVFGTVPTAAKSNGSIPDSSKVPRSRPGSSGKQHGTF